VLHEARRRDEADAEDQRGADAQQRDLVLVCALKAAASCGALFLGRQFLRLLLLGRGAMAATLGGGGGKVISPSNVTVAPRITSSSML
jgi:hypothetical protein